MVRLDQDTGTLNLKLKRDLTPPPRGALINEAFTGLELPRLLVQTPALAIAPRGSGERVLVWPGFGAGDASTTLLRTYLSYLGYDVSGWGLGRNGGDVFALLDRLREIVVAEARDAPVRLVGWSLGGYLAREVARDCPESVRQVVTLGSPVVGGPKYTAVAGAFDGRGMTLDTIETLVEARYETPLKVPVTAIYSKLDGVVAWQACIDERSPDVEHVEVLSTHLGLGFAAPVLRIVARRLAGTANARRD